MSKPKTKKVAPLVNKSFGKGQSIINEEIFGQTFDSVSPKEGLSHLKVEVYDLGNIPGVVSHWQKDLEHRRQDILAVKNQGLWQRASQWFQKKNHLSPEVSAEEIYSLHPTNTAKQFYEDLQKNPASMMYRLQLVSLVGKSGRQFSIEIYRKLLLHSSVACLFGDLSSMGLQIVFWSQETYLSKFFYKCKDQLYQLEAKLDPTADQDEGYARQVNEQIHRVKQCMNLIKAYQKHTRRGLHENQSTFDSILSMSELLNCLAESKKGQDEKIRLIFKKAADITFIIRYLPLLHPVAHEYLDTIIKISPHSPLPYFFKARILMSDLIFKVAQLQAQGYNKKNVRAVQQSFKDAYHFYGLAVSRIHPARKSQTDFTILIEYAHLVHYFYKVTVNIIGVKPPREWLKLAFSKAHRALDRAKASGKIKLLREELLEDMQAEGLVS